MTRILVVLLLLATVQAEPAPALLPLKDGRVLHGRSVERRPKEAVLGTDFGALKEGYVSITPLELDLTHYKAMDVLKKWDWK